jgi:chaperonin GroEL
VPQSKKGSCRGGGVALLRCTKAIEEGIKSKRLHGDQLVGARIVLKAIEAPIRNIVENAGLEAALVVDHIRNSKSESEGFDAAKEEYVDMIKAGIIDPAKVTRVALENAASVAGLILTSEAAIYEKPKEKEAPPPMPGGGGMGGMGGMDMM